MKKFIIFLILIFSLTPLFAEMDWENMTMKVTADNRIGAIENLKHELYALAYDNNETVGGFLKRNFECENSLAILLNQHCTMNRRYLTDGGVEIEYQLNLGSKILSLLLPEIKPVKLVVPMLCPCCGQEWPKNKPIPNGLELIPKEIETSNYTGIIIDCRGLAINPCLFPKIYNERREEIYSINFANPTYAIEQGLILYTSKDLYNNSRIGYNPLRIRATGIIGGNKTDITISSFDGRRIHGSKKNLELLKECRIAIIANL